MRIASLAAFVVLFPAAAGAANPPPVRRDHRVSQFSCPANPQAIRGVPQASGEWKTPISSGSGYTGPLSWIRPRMINGSWDTVICGFPGRPGPRAIVKMDDGTILIRCFFGEPDRCGGQSMSSYLQMSLTGYASCDWDDAHSRFDCPRGQ